MSTNCVRLLVLMRSVFMPGESSRDGNDKVGASVLEAGMPLDFLESRLTTTRRERQKTKLARLQRLARINQIGQEFLMCGDRSRLAIQCAANHLLELFRLVFDLVLRRFNSGLQRRIQNGHRV